MIRLSKGVMSLGGFCSIGTPLDNVVNIYEQSIRIMKNGNIYYGRNHFKKEDWEMERRLIIDGNEVYEIDEACMIKKKVEVREEEDRKKHESHLNRYQHGYQHGKK